MAGMRLRSLVAALLLAAAPAGSAAALERAALLGPRLELEGLAIRPPAGFAPLEVVGEETGALAPGAPGAGRKLLLSLLREPDAIFTVSRIEAPIDAASGARDRLARAALDHAREALGVDVRLLWAEYAHGGVQLGGRYDLAGRERGLLLAFLPLGHATGVVALAAPAEAIASLEPAFARVMESIEPLGQEPEAQEGIAFLAAASLLGGAALASFLRDRAAPPSKRRR